MRITKAELQEQLTEKDELIARQDNYIAQLETIIQVVQKLSTIEKRTHEEETQKS